MSARLPVIWPYPPLTPYWERAWVDPGGTVFGPGPYLHVTCHHPGDPQGREYERVLRVYPPDGIEVSGVERDGKGWAWIVTETERGE